MFSWLKRKKPFRIVGLTGGIGSGKSAVAEFFKKAGLSIINLDSLGRELSDSSPEIRSSVETAFGPEAVSAAGLNRQYLREVIFASAVKRKKLEAILHPIILNEFYRRAEALREAGAPLVICEAALLIESGTYQELDGLIVVTAPEAVRLQRVQSRDGISEALAQQMIAAQVSDERRLSLATEVIENNSTLEELEKETKKLVKKLL